MASTLRGVLLILATGFALGLAYNALGLSSRPASGLPWIAEDRVAAIERLPGVGSGYGAGDDPMAIGAANGLPSIPELDRPIEIELDAVRQFVEERAALVVDAREPDEFAAGHLPGAVNLPYDEAMGDPTLLEALDSGGRPIIVYCGGGTCELSIGLAYDMIYAGQRRVVVYTGGFAEWSEAGHAVERGDAG